MSNDNDRNVNVPLLRKAVEWVEEQDKLPVLNREWFQGNWVSDPEYIADELSYTLERDVDPAECGTAYCLAGYVGQLLEPAYRENSMMFTKENPEGLHVSDFARKALGVTQEEGCRLFEAGNEAADIRNIAEEIAGEKL